MTDPDPAKWTRADPIRALEFVLAGSIGEREALRHSLPSSFVGDLDVWRRGMGLHDGMEIFSFESVIGQPLQTVLQRTSAWVRSNLGRISAVAAALARIDSSTGSFLASPESGPWVLTSHEVARVAGEPPPGHLRSSAK
jgi:hypothetical protein